MHGLTRPRASRTVLIFVLALTACAPAAGPGAGSRGASPASAPAASSAQEPRGAAPAAAPNESDALEQLVAAARREGQLTLTWTENAGSREGIRRWIEGFNKH